MKSMNHLIKTSIIIFALSIGIAPLLHSQATYFKEQLTLTNMLSGKDSLNLQKAVFAIENAYYNDKLNEKFFNLQIDQYANFCQRIMQSGDIRYEGKGDEQAAKTQCAVFGIIRSETRNGYTPWSSDIYIKKVTTNNGHVL